MIKDVGHIGIAVKDIEDTLAAVAKALNVSMPQVNDVPGRNLRFAVVKIGQVALEFIQDKSVDGEFAKFVRERGNAIHHVAFLTDDIEGDVELLKKRGVDMVDQRPKIGVRGKKIAFTAKTAFNGIPFELTEP
jgi:methylmalonyl-CoA/ethylmalonyl-CoA epimerase